MPRAPGSLCSSCGPSSRLGSSVQIYPLTDLTGIPTQVAISDLGRGLQQLLADNGHPELPHVGYPITMHYRGDEALTAVECLVRCADQKVDGFVHVSKGGPDRAIDAPGLATFYPLHPLTSGADVVVTWSWNVGDGGMRFERQASFRTR